ncbi:hypothetical protein BKA81DRAFT_370195 [Phyllosticta paracitricarpa]
MHRLVLALCFFWFILGTVGVGWHYFGDLGVRWMDVCLRSGMHPFSFSTFFSSLLTRAVRQRREGGKEGRRGARRRRRDVAIECAFRIHAHAHA